MSLGIADWVLQARAKGSLSTAAASYGIFEAARLPSEFAAGFWVPSVWRPAWLPRLRAEAEACLAPCLGPGGGRLFAAAFRFEALELLEELLELVPLELNRAAFAGRLEC